MQTSQGGGTRHLHLWTPVLPSHNVVGSFSMQDALSLGPANFNPKLNCPLLKLSKLQCHKLYVMSFLSWDYYRKRGSEISRFFVLSPMCIARFLKTTQVPSNWQGSPSFALEPSTSKYATIIFTNMCGRGLSKYSPLTPRIRLLMLLPSPCNKKGFFTSSSPHVRQVTSTSYQSKGVLNMRNFGTYFTGTYMFLLVPCKNSCCTIPLGIKISVLEVQSHY
jgi:hypothetical protein